MHTIYLFGDSTCQTNDEYTYPQVGWGQFLKDYVKSEYRVVNLARNGRSTKSFIDEGLYLPCLAKIKKGDFLFIQFGHNDEKKDEKRGTLPFTTYTENLLFFINIARKKGATPVLLSSIYRRQFINGKIVDNTHLDYPLAMYQLAKRENVHFIDLCELTKSSLSALGEEDSKTYFMNLPPHIYPNYSFGKEDNTHLVKKGALLVITLLLNELKKHDDLSIILK